jgi:hypothetical protein
MVAHCADGGAQSAYAAPRCTATVRHECSRTIDRRRPPPPLRSVRAAAPLALLRRWAAGGACGGGGGGAAALLPAACWLLREAAVGDCCKSRRRDRADRLCARIKVRVQSPVPGLQGLLTKSTLYKLDC